MSLPTISPAQFSGFVNVSADTYSTTDFASFITSGINRHIRYLLGDEAFIDIDLTTKTIYTALFSGVYWVDEDGKNRVCDSLTQILVLLIYADWVSEGHLVSTDVGIVSNMNENAVGPSGMVQGAAVVKRLARASMSWEDSIASFIEHYRKVKQVITAVDNTDPLNPILTVSRAATDYLEDGEVVTILGVAYTAANVLDESFSVEVATSGLGLSFVDQESTWEPLFFVQDELPLVKTGFC